MDFDSYSVTIKNKIMESPEIDNIFKQQFNDCFDYVYKLYKSNKELEPNLIKIYLEEVKGYKNIKMSDFIRLLFILSFCGFEFENLTK